MIKIEDNVSVVLLSIALVFHLMYAFMHIFDPFAVLLACLPSKLIRFVSLIKVCR